MSLRLVLILFAVTGLAACQKPAAAESRAADTAPPVSRAAAAVDEDKDVWDRIGQCANQAERVGARVEREFNGRPGEMRLTSWNNHYNRIDRRCYIQLDFFDPKAAADKRRLTPLMHSQLFDAFENLDLAIHTQQPLDEIARGGYCRTADPSGDRSTSPVDCAAAKMFILEKMTR